VENTELIIEKLPCITCGNFVKVRYKQNRKGGILCKKCGTIAGNIVKKGLDVGLGIWN